MAFFLFLSGGGRYKTQRKGKNAETTTKRKKKKEITDQ